MLHKDNYCNYCDVINNNVLDVIDSIVANIFSQDIRTLNEITRKRSREIMHFNDVIYYVDCKVLRSKVFARKLFK